MRNSIESSLNETTLEVAAGGDNSNNDDDNAKRKVFHLLYRVTILVVPNLPLTPKSKSCVLVHGPHAKTELLF